MSFIHPIMVRLDQRIDQLVEASRVSLERRLDHDEYVSQCAKIEAYREIRSVCVELEKEDQ